MHKFRQRRTKLVGVLACTAIAAMLASIGAGAAQTSRQPVVARAAAKASGEGVIKGVNAAERKVKIAHGPIPALQWPAMTMAFGLSANVDITGLAEGAKVKFTLSRDSKGPWVVDEIRRAE